MNKQGRLKVILIIIVIVTFLIITGLGLILYTQEDNIKTSSFFSESIVIEKKIGNFEYNRTSEREKNNVITKAALYEKDGLLVNVIISKELSRKKALEAIDGIRNEVVENHHFTWEEKMIGKNKVIWSYETRIYNNDENQRFLEIITFWNSGKYAITIREFPREFKNSEITFFDTESRELIDEYLSEYPSDM